MFLLPLIAYQLKPELFVPKLDATKCARDIFDPQLPHNDTSPEVFCSNPVIFQECVITLCLLASSNYFLS